MKTGRKYAPSPFEALLYTEALSGIHNLLENYIGLSLFLISRDGRTWRVLYRHPGMTETPFSYYISFKGSRLRDLHIRRSIQTAIRTRKTQCVVWSGFKELFVPVVQKGRGVAVLWMGEFLLKALTRSDLNALWRDVSGQEPIGLNSEYHQYVNMVLARPVFEPPVEMGVRRLMELQAEAIAGERPPVRIHQEVESLRKGILSERLPHLNWLNDFMSWSRLQSWPWKGKLPGYLREEFRVERAFTTVISVTLRPSTSDTHDTIDSLVNEYQLACECFAFARTLSQTTSGVFNGSVVFLTSTNPQKNKNQAALEIREKAEKIQDFVQRKFRSHVAVGIGRPREMVRLHLSLQEALSAVNTALDKGLSIFSYPEREEQERTTRLSDLDQAARSMAFALSRQMPSRLESARNRYIHQALELSRLKPEAVRVHFYWTAMDLLEKTRRSASTQKRVLDERILPLLEALENSLTVREALDLFRQVLDSLVEIILRPREGERRIKIEMALRYIRENCDRPLRLPQVAEWAGYSASAFTRAFKAHVGRTFPEYLTRLRIEQARTLLRTGRASVTWIAQNCGFSSTAYFVKMFRELEGSTPARFRKAHADSGQ
jgi:AraC-like DNA-binding protein